MTGVSLAALFNLVRGQRRREELEALRLISQSTPTMARQDPNGQVLDRMRERTKATLMGMAAQGGAPALALYGAQTDPAMTQMLLARR